jgi:hypothetical protein
MPNTPTKISPDVIGQTLTSLGKIGVDIVDASKRRQMDFNFNQQRLQSELGLAEKAQQQNFEIARLTAIANAAKGNETDKKKDNTMLYVGVGVVGLVLIGGILYAVKNK